MEGRGGRCGLCKRKARLSCRTRRVGEGELVSFIVTCSTDESTDSVWSEVSRLSRGSALLAGHSQVCREKERALDEFARRIRARTDLFIRLYSYIHSLPSRCPLFHL